jgi:hypothetical protein
MIMSTHTLGGRVVAVASGKIDDMKMTWPLAIVVGIALLVIGAITMFGQGDASIVVSVISLLVNAMLYGELREVKSQTNGSTSRLLEELASYREQQQKITTQALNSPALPPAREDV